MGNASAIRSSESCGAAPKLFGQLTNPMNLSHLSQRSEGSKGGHLEARQPQYQRSVRRMGDRCDAAGCEQTEDKAMTRRFAAPEVDVYIGRRNPGVSTGCGTGMARKKDPEL